MKTNSSIRLLTASLGFLLGATLSSLASPLQLVTAIDSASTPSAGGGGDSWNPIVTPDGRYVLFASRANNLVSSDTNNPFLDQVPPKLNVFLRDRVSGTTTLVSVNSTGTGPGNGDSIPTALSTNGQFALFESDASDIMPGDTNNATDVFLRDLVNGTNQLISISTDGGFGVAASWESAMTPDGRYVAFASLANNLVPNDTNGIQDVFVRDMRSGVTKLASPGAIKVYYPSSSDSPHITPDGRFVAFRTTAKWLVYTSASIVNEIYVRDLVAGTTTLVSSNQHKLFSGTPNSYNQAISDDGQFIVFESSPGAIGVVGNTGVIQRYNLQSGFTDIIYTNAVGTYAYNHFRSVDMTPDGRWVTFVGNTDSSGNTSSVFIWDAQSGVATLASTNLSGSVPSNSVCDFPTIDPSGRWIAFLSTATNLTTNVVAGDFHLYVHDLQSGITTLVDAGLNGAGLAKDFLSSPRLTPDGHFVAFDCTDADLVGNDNNQAYDVFMHDLNAGTNDLISVRQSTLPSQTPEGAAWGPIYSANYDGRYLAFCGTGNGLLAAGYTNIYRGVFVHDQFNNSNLLASVDTNGLGGANGWSFDPSISGDGRLVAFTSGANNLVMGDNNANQDVFVRDWQNGTTTLVSVNSNGNGTGDLPSFSPKISSSGRFVLFHSDARNLASGSFNGSENLFLRDLQLGITYAITTSTLGFTAGTMTPDGRFTVYGLSASPAFVVWDSQIAAPVYTNMTSSKISAMAISPDGNLIAYSTSGGFYACDRGANSNWLIGASVTVSNAGFQFSADSRYLVYATAAAQIATDTNGVADVYVYDFQMHSNVLISQSYLWPGAANGPSDSPNMSADGRFVAYRSFAGDLVPGTTNGQPNVFMFDRLTGATTLLSATLFGSGAANNSSAAPIFSGDGHTLVFSSFGSDLVSGDFNQSGDLFAFVFLYARISGSGSTPTINWPASSGQTYSVEYKDDLNSSDDWQPVPGTVTINGNRGYLTDTVPALGHRFYRVVAGN